MFIIVIARGEENIIEAGVAGEREISNLKREIESARKEIKIKVVRVGRNGLNA